MVAFLALLGPIGTFLVSLWNALKPPAIVEESEKAGAATQEVTTLEAHDAEVQTTAEAGAAVDRAIASPGGLQQFVKSDPNNRANG